jgi:site-specific DNA recombinase
MGVFDTMESEVKAERVAASAVQRAQAGRPSGVLGYGWIVEGSGSKPHIGKTHIRPEWSGRK